MSKELSAINVQPMLLLGSDAFLTFDDFNQKGERKWAIEDIEGLLEHGIVVLTRNGMSVNAIKSSNVYKSWVKDENKVLVFED